MVLELLPTLTADAAENMANDFLLLQRYPREAVARFRHYGWRGPAFTFAKPMLTRRSGCDTLPEPEYDCYTDETDQYC